MVEMLRLTLRPESTTQTYQETGEGKKLLQLRLVIKVATIKGTLLDVLQKR